MPSSSNNSADNGCSFFDHPHAEEGQVPFIHPCPAPPLPTPLSSCSACSTPEGFVLPAIPPHNDPLFVVLDLHGHRQLSRLSNTPLHVDDHRVLKLVQDVPVIGQKCYNCAEKAIEYSFMEAGIPCPPCAVLGIPDCRWSDPHWFMKSLHRKCDNYLLEERNELMKSVQENHLTPSLFNVSLTVPRHGFIVARRELSLVSLSTPALPITSLSKVITRLPLHLPTLPLFSASCPLDGRPVSIPSSSRSSPSVCKLSLLLCLR
ncbi:hypothetical protein K438DRAFT_2028373, partial [Mycena galopus ATCC 62051]